MRIAHVPILPVSKWQRLEFAQDHFRPIAGSIPINDPISNQVMGKGSCRKPVIGGFTHTRDCSTDVNILPHVSTCVDTGEHEIGLYAQSKKCNAHAISGCSVHTVAIRVQLFHDQILGCGDSVPALRLFRGWRNDRVSGLWESFDGSFQCGQTGRMNAIIVRQEKMHV